MQKEGGKCIIIEDNQPTYLVTKLEDYEKASDKSSSPEIEEANREIAEWQAEEKEEPEIANSSQEVKVEDLPF